MNAHSDTSVDAGVHTVYEQLRELVAEHRTWLGGMADLLGAEARRAGITLALLACCAGLLMVVGAAIWIFACATAVAAVVAAGATWTSALLTVTFMNILLAGGLWITIERLSRNLGFRGTRRVLRPDNSDLKFQSTTTEKSDVGTA